MPAGTYHDPERPKGQQAVPCYVQTGAAGWTVTDAALEAARQVRREAGSDNAWWGTMKADCGRFAKDEQKRAQRMEKAATIWLRHFEEPGLKSIRKMPVELAEELDAVWRAMALA